MKKFLWTLLVLLVVAGGIIAYLLLGTNAYGNHNKPWHAPVTHTVTPVAPMTPAPTQMQPMTPAPMPMPSWTPMG